MNVLSDVVYCAEMQPVVCKKRTDTDRSSENNELLKTTLTELWDKKRDNVQTTRRLKTD